MGIRWRDNRLLWTMLIIYGLFISVGLYIPKPNISNGTAIAALIAGTIMAARYSREAFKILFQGKTGDNNAHLAILGVAEIGYGLVYSGGYRLLWNWMGQPDSWIGTVWSSIGLLAIAKGAYRLGVTPDEVAPIHRFPDSFKMIALLAFGVVVGIVVGVNMTGMR